MSRLQRASGLLRALQGGAAAALQRGSAATASCSECAPAAWAIAAHQAQRRPYAAPSAPVAPAATSVPIDEEWYLRQRSLITLGNRVPALAVGAYVAPNAVVVGDVDLADRVSVWDGAVLRGDLNNITVGSVTNIQDRTVVHAARTSPTGLTAATLIGKFVTIGPNCVLRSCRVQDFCEVGARSVLLEGSLMEPYSALAPGSVLPPARRVPEGELWGGAPARFVRKLTADEKGAAQERAERVRVAAWARMAEELPHGTAWRRVEAARAALAKAGGYEAVDLRSAKLALRRDADAISADRSVSLPGGGSGVAQ